MRMESKPSSRILVVDDHPVVREGFATVIKRQRDLICCGGVGSVEETYEAVARLRPDLVLLDLWLGGADGLELIKSLKSQFPLLRIPGDLFLRRSDLCGTGPAGGRAGIRVEGAATQGNFDGHSDSPGQRIVRQSNDRPSDAA